MISKDRLLIQQQIYNFLRTVTIKFDPIAQYQNADLVARGYSVNDAAPATWKYYLNLTGEYHVSDTQMHVVSLDTHQTILFHPSTLAVHPRTRSVYVPGGLYYNRLCETYPDQVDLIKSILFPIGDINTAIMADNFALLGYGSGFLEDYEESPLVMEIEKFLKIVEERWYFDFLDDEKFFHLSFWGSLWTYLAMLLMSARESYVKTPYVHNWHVWNELQSHGLDDYSDILDRERSMMLYQNIDYLKGNAGKQSNLVILANRLLSSFGVSIYSRRVVQESETGQGQYQLTPQLQAVRIPTDNYNITVEIADETVETMQARVFAKGLAVENTAEAAAVKERALGDTTLNRFMTKFLEIRPITRNKIYADQLNMFLMETLVTSVLEGYYANPVTVSDIATGATLYLYPRELLAIYHYASQKSLGLTPTQIPNQFFLYKAFTPTIGTPDKTIWHGSEKLYIKQHFDPTEILAELNYNTAIETPADFTEMLSRLWLRYMDHMLIDTSTSIERRRYILEYLMSMCHERRVVTQQLVPGFDDYATLFGQGGLDIASSILAQYDIQKDPQAAWGSLADAITSALVPINDLLASFGNFTLSDLGYERLRQLFVQMCSYRVVFLESSRALAEFAIGAKWSHYYGPDSMDTYNDTPFIIYTNYQDNTQLNAAMTRHSGFTEQHVTKIISEADYTVTPDSVRAQDKTEDYRESSPRTIRSSSSFTSQGSLVIQRQRVTAALAPEIGGGESYLLDTDGSMIKDADGDILVDPNIDGGVPESYLTDIDGTIVADADGVPISDIDDPNMLNTAYVIDSDGQVLLDSDSRPVRDPIEPYPEEDFLLMDNDGTVLMDDDGVDIADPATVESEDAFLVDEDGAILTDGDQSPITDDDEE